MLEELRESRNGNQLETKDHVGALPDCAESELLAAIASREADGASSPF